LACPALRLGRYEHGFDYATGRVNDTVMRMLATSDQHRNVTAAILIEAVAKGTVCDGEGDSNI